MKRYTLLLWATVVCSSASAQRIHRQGFETEAKALALSLTDGKVEVVDHQIRTDNPHAGSQAERVVARIKSGTFAYVEYAPPAAMLIEELTLSAWVASNAPGIKLLARVVLPREKDDQGQPLITTLPGDVYEVTNGRWLRLSVRRLDLLLQKQQQFLQAERRRAVDVRGAYVDRLLFNIHAGIGEVELSVDDIEVGPIVAPTQQVELTNPNQAPITTRTEEGEMPKVTTPTAAVPAANQPPARAVVVGDRLLLGEKPFFIRGIELHELPLDLAGEMGFNVALLPWDATAEAYRRAESLGMQTLPMLPPGLDATRSPSDAHRLVNLPGFGIYVPTGHDATDKTPPVLESLQRFDGLRNRPLTSEVTNHLRARSRTLDLVGIHRDLLASDLTPDNYLTWLTQRRNLARPGTLLWSRVQTHWPTELVEQIQSINSQNTNNHLGPTPGQLRQMTYLTLASGCRGTVLSSDGWLTDRYGGRARMLQAALLNLELRLIEPFLASGKPPVALRTSHPDVGAVMCRHDRGVLALAYWKRPGSQFVLGQAAVNDVQLIIESAAEASQAFEISLGDIQGLRPRRDLGGLRVRLAEFDTAAAVVLTTDTTLLSRYQELIQQLAPQAAPWQQELAQIELTAAEEVLARLESINKSQMQAKDLLVKARQTLEESKQESGKGRHSAGLLLATRCSRLVRQAEETVWRNATKPMSTMVSLPPAASFHSLPELYQLQQQIEQSTFSANVLLTGNFERDGRLDADGWQYRPQVDETVRPAAYIVTDAPAEGQRCLELSLTPADEAPLIVENSRVEMVSPAVPVQAGQLLRISGAVQLPNGSAGSVDGALVWDTLGGAGLAWRSTKAGGWQKFVLFRVAPRAVDLRVHLAMTGLGAAKFDDLKIEIATPRPTAPIARRTEPIFR